MSRSTGSNVPPVTERPGEGTDDHYPRPLVGERSVAGLARLIAKTMPEDAPGECVGEDADKVAAYIYESFYSKAAQARNKFQPPRIELSRLTVRQYRNAVADLIGSFRAPGRWDDQRGLKGEYSSRSRRRRDGNGGGSSLNRVDPEIHFDFGTDSPIPEQNALKDIAKSWQRIPVLLVPLVVLQGVLAGVQGQLAGVGARSGDRRVRIPRQDGERHAAVGQRQGPAVDRRRGEVGQRHRVSRVDLPAGRASLSLAAGVLSVQGKNVIDRARVETPAAGLRGDSAAEPLAELVPGNVRLADPVSAGRPQRRL